MSLRILIVNSTFYPQGETRLQEGDEVTVQTEPATLKLLHKWNTATGAR